MATPPTTAIDAPIQSLAAGAAHDLRNVLFVIRAHCERLIEATAPEDSRREDLEAIKDAVERGASLASELVQAGRPQRRMRPLDVNQAIKGIEPLVRRLVGDRVTVTLRLSTLSWPVTANSVQLEQVVMNLAVNARDAMPEGGGLTIATENRTLTGAGVGQPSQFVVISVTDTGLGVDPAVADRIFEPYFTTKGNGGTGVGLATVRAIAMLNGGHVEMSTVPGQGTTMRVVLPRAQAAPQPDAERTAPAADGAQKRILLVENERAIREFLQRCLTAEGYDVQAAASGAEALHLCEPPLPSVDLVVTDVHLPDIGGPAVASRLKAVWPHVGLVFISGDGEGLGNLTDEGRVPVLAKPFTTAELVTAVRSALAAGHAA
ncbi:MAG TPA: ATP-binding protein [Vicinamibacterales bacterium]|nr:ATP-binding protein [Vicinamibacterales bacterium]